MKVAVIIPAFKVRKHLIDVIHRIGSEVTSIYVVDDACPEQSGKFIESSCKDSRLFVVFNEHNLGVGGATMAGYAQAIHDGHDILVKVDGDGQMNPELIPMFIAPIIEGVADYTKGNRFYDLTQIGQMPTIRLLGNAALSFMAKASTGYWDVFDPTNGYTAIHAKVAAHLPLEKISKRYFFESDMLFRLNIMKCAVLDIPMDANYGDEVSNLKIANIAGEFFKKHTQNCGKRIFYNYFLRDLSAASLHLVIGSILCIFGGIFGIYHWISSIEKDTFTAAGTVMVAALPLIMGLQFLLAFVLHDTQSTPRLALHKRLYSARPPASIISDNSSIKSDEY